MLFFLVRIPTVCKKTLNWWLYQMTKTLYIHVTIVNFLKRSLPGSQSASVQENTLQLLTMTSNTTFNTRVVWCLLLLPLETFELNLYSSLRLAQCLLPRHMQQPTTATINNKPWTHQQDIWLSCQTHWSRSLWCYTKRVWAHRRELNSIGTV